jgi:hypothetical protein
MKNNRGEVNRQYSRCSISDMAYSLSSFLIYMAPQLLNTRHIRRIKKMDLLYWRGLVHTDPWDGHLLEELRRCHSASRILRCFRLEVRIVKCSLIQLSRFPNSIVDKHTASSNTSMQLCGNEFGLLLKVCCICCPSP